MFGEFSNKGLGKIISNYDFDYGFMEVDDFVTIRLF